jgi:hypothetical protein
VAITFIHNLLRRHPSCNVLVHRNGDTELAATPPPVGDTAAALAALDPYLPHAVKPAESDAIKSSLWELHALKTHLYPQVSCLCSSSLSAPPARDTRVTGSVSRDGKNGLGSSLAALP